MKSGNKAFTRLFKPEHGITQTTKFRQEYNRLAEQGGANSNADEMASCLNFKENNRLKVSISKESKKAGRCPVQFCLRLPGMLIWGGENQSASLRPFPSLPRVREL